MQEQILNLLESLNISSLNCEKIHQYGLLLQKWNKSYRLVGDANSDVLFDKHLADSLMVAGLLDPVDRLVDLGSGAGLPGLPLHLIQFARQTTLVDSLRKRMQFCDAVRRELGCKNLSTLCARVESDEVQSLLGSLGSNDLVISRATWPLKDFLPMVRAALQVGAKVIAMKGVNWESELSECEGDLSPQVIHYQLPISGLDRYLLIFG